MGVRWFFFFFKQKTAYEMRISDWSSDVCSSDLLTDTERRALFGVPTAREDLARHYMLSARDLALVAARRGDTNRIGFAVQLAEIGRASCRERVCQYV